ncbi:hypothetical protein SAMN05216251_105299 [Actinacidiphila alni]|uniref:Uncharacterized protein n=1 Tax=Actinacidiphila alni TaxID=380248 RepID=A0A1I2DME4_9ACTN|nr:hypothetical protein [Actinacidiphila alni]SFE81627.1 hypothetical protein SAMN05216251_105299 [Actinacidiphila alni]
MDDAIEKAARAAAQRLTGPTYPTLAEDVEEALAVRGATTAPGQYFNPTELGGLIVAIANTAWMIYHDIRSRGAGEPDVDAIARRVRQQLQQEGRAVPELEPAERDRIIDVTVEETVNAQEE